MFWRRKAAPVEASNAAPRDDLERRLERADAELDACREALARILRSLGQHPIPLDDELDTSIGGRFESWAAHVLVLAPLADERGQRPTRRDFPRLVGFVEAHRKKEREHVVTSASSMREALVSTLQSIGTSLLGQAKADTTVTAHLTRLRATVETASLEELRREALAVASGITDVLEEQRRRTREQTDRLGEQLGALREQLDEAQRDGETDALTRLSNRRAFDKGMERTCLVARVMGRKMSLLLIDIDHFKRVNDRHGHAAGDTVLRELADVLTRCFPRRSDVVARYGGEEFAIILTDTSLKDAKRLARRFLEALRGLRIAYGDRTLGVTASVGAGELADNECAADLVVRTDRALYRAKETGRDRVVEAAPPIPSACTDARGEVGMLREAG